MFLSSGVDTLLQRRIIHSTQQTARNNTRQRAHTRSSTADERRCRANTLQHIHKHAMGKRTRAQAAAAATPRNTPGGPGRHGPQHASANTTTQQRRRAEVIVSVQKAVREAQAAAAHPASAEERMREHLLWLRTERNQNTAKTYSSAMKQFQLWATTIENHRRTRSDKVNCDRPSPLDVSLYVTYLVQVKQGSRAVVNGALAAISDHIRYERTAEYDPCNSALTQQTRDVLLPKARLAVSKKELTWRDMSRLLDAIDAAEDVDSWLRDRDAVMIMLAYSALLRGSEITRMKRADIEIKARSEDEQQPATKKARTTLSGKSTATADPDDGRRIMRVYVDPLCKNDAERKGHTRLLEERPTQDGKRCVVRHMQRWLGTMSCVAASSSAAQLLFPTRNGGTMSNDTPRGRLTTWLKRAGFTDVDQYGFHSLRAGGATDASRAGASELDIQRHGNWRSNIVQTYIRSDVNDQLKVSTALAQVATASRR